MFDVLGVPAMRGRVLTSDDAQDHPGAPPAVLSYAFWQRRFNADRNIVGKLLVCAGLAQVPPQIPPPDRFPAEDRDPKLPNGKSQHDAIVQDDHKRNLKDAAELVRLAADLQADLEKDDAFVVNLKTIKKTDDIEKLARNIRGRLKR